MIIFFYNFSMIFSMIFQKNFWDQFCPWYFLQPCLNLSYEFLLWEYTFTEYSACVLNRSIMVSLTKEFTNLWKWSSANCCETVNFLEKKRTKTKNNSLNKGEKHGIPWSCITSRFNSLMVGIYEKIGNNENFSKTQTLIILSKFMKLYIQWSKIDQFRDDLTMFGALKFEAKFFKFLLIPTNFRKLPVADLSKDHQMLSWIFFILRLHILYW